jgi:hypothetical protein
MRSRSTLATAKEERAEDVEESVVFGTMAISLWHNSSRATIRQSEDDG